MFKVLTKSFSSTLQDILRKIRECGSSVTYYGGRVVQTSTSSPSASAAANPLELNSCGKNFNKTMAASTCSTTMSLNNPTMMTQTQTRARVREIETCCSAAADTTACTIKATNNNECQLHGKQLEQKNFHLLKSNKASNNGSNLMTSHNQGDQNNVQHKVQGFDKPDQNRGTCIFTL